MGVDPQHPAILEAMRRGLIPSQAVQRPAAPKEPKPALVEASFTPPGVWVVPMVLPSLANESAWRTRSRTSHSHRVAVSRALGRRLAAVAVYADMYHRGEPVRVVLTRLGGKALDRTANLPASLKYVEDGVALVMGADDGSPLWRCECHQEPGGPCGVRIELRAA